MDIKDSYLHGAIGIVKSISVDADKLTYILADRSNTPVEVTMPIATTIANGLLSSADKTKLDSLELGTSYQNLATVVNTGSETVIYKKVTITKSSTDGYGIWIHSRSLHYLLNSGAEGMTTIKNTFWELGTNVNLTAIASSRGIRVKMVAASASATVTLYIAMEAYTYFQIVSSGLINIEDSTKDIYDGITSSTTGWVTCTSAQWTDTTYNVVNNSANGLAPKVISTNTANVTSAYYVLASSNGTSTPSWYKLPDTAFNNDDTKVTQTNTSSNSNYRILFSGNANDTTETTTVRKATTLLFNPSTGTLSTNSLNLNGDIVINDGVNKDRYIKWLYNNLDQYGWRIGYLGDNNVHGTDNNALVLDSCQGTKGWATALKFDQNSMNATFTKDVTATTFIGNLDGQYVDKLTNYAEATAVAAISANDSLNTALGKLEKKANVIYNDLFGVDNDDIINKWDEIVDFIDSVKEGTDIINEFVTVKTDLTITGLKTFESESSTTGISLILKNKGWTANMSTAMDFYNGSAYKVPNARIETKMVGDGKKGGTLIFYTQTAHASTNPNPNGLTERFRLGDDGTSTLSGSFMVTSDVTADSFITDGGTASQFVKGDGSLDSNTYALASALGSYLPLAGGTMTGTIKSLHILPKSKNTYSLGNTDYRWVNLYSANIYSDTIYNGASIYASGNEIIHGGSDYFELNKGYPDAILWLNASEYKFKLGSDGVQFMIAANGNVGIGDVGGAPAYKLHIGGGDLMADTVHAWSGGFKKNGSSNSYVLLGGGGHKALTDLFTSLTSNSTNIISITVGGTTKTITKDTLATNLGLGSNAYTSIAYLPLAGGQMNDSAYISWNTGSDGNDVSDWSSITANGLRIISSTSETSKAPSQYSTALHVKGRYGFLLASEGGATAKSFYIANIGNKKLSGGLNWFLLLHSDNYSFYLPILNSASTHATNESVIYAPSTAGTSGQVLTSTAGTPGWTNLSSLSVGTASQLSNTSISSGANLSTGASGQYVKWYSQVSLSSGYAGNNYGFPVYNNANGILWMGTHSGPYGGLLGISSDGRIYYRFITNNSFPTTANGGSWNKIAWTSDLTWSNISGKPTIPTVTDYYWANVKVSSTSNTATQPTFGETTISGGLLKITNNSNTTTIGSQNASFCHVYNSASIPFIVNNSLLSTSGNLGNTTYRWEDLYLKKLIDINYSTGSTDIGTKITGSTYSIGFIIGSGNTNRGIYDYTNSKWMLYSDATTTYIPKWASLGSTYSPVYFNSTGKPIAATSYAKAIKTITRSGTTFTYTCIDGTTGTFTQQDNNSTYNVFGKTINANFKTAYRTLTKGNTSQGYYIAAIRNDTNSVADSPVYGTGLAFGMADTHGYLYMDYLTELAWLGAGNSDKLLWVKKLAFADGTGASGTWSIDVSGNAGTSSRLKILDLRGTNHLPNSSNYPAKHVTGWFNSTGTPTSAWYSGLTIKGWDNTYQTWLIASGSTTAINEKLYYRCGITNSSGTATWNDWKQIAFTSDFSGLFTALSLSSGTLSATIGGTTKSVILSISKLGTDTIGATGRPIYLNAGTPTPITVSASTSTLYIAGVASSTGNICTGTQSTSGVRIVGGDKLYAYGGFFESSDECLKDFYEDIDVDLEKLAQLPKKYFKWKDGSKELHIGTSAQELQKLYPELVSSTEGILHVSYDKLSIVALKGIDKLYKEMLELKQRINKLENYGNRC